MHPRTYLNLYVTVTGLVDLSPHNHVCLPPQGDTSLFVLANKTVEASTNSAGEYGCVSFSFVATVYTLQEYSILS